MAPCAAVAIPVVGRAAERESLRGALGWAGAGTGAVALDLTDGRGADRGVEAVGWQAHDAAGEEHPELVLDNLVKVVRSTGGIGVVGVYVPTDPGVPDSANAGRIGWDYGTFFTKGQTMGTGQAPVKRYNRQLRDLILTGAAKPSFLVSHEVPLVDAVDAYDVTGRCCSPAAGHPRAGDNPGTARKRPRPDRPASNTQT